MLLSIFMEYDTFRISYFYSNMVISFSNCPELLCLFYINSFSHLIWRYAWFYPLFAYLLLMITFHLKCIFDFSKELVMHSVNVYVKYTTLSYLVCLRVILSYYSPFSPNYVAPAFMDELIFTSNSILSEDSW
jgi:hypothetical protein